METPTASNKPSGLTPILSILNTFANVFPGKLSYTVLAVIFPLRCYQHLFLYYKDYYYY